jgi:hypothetical protein
MYIAEFRDEDAGELAGGCNPFGALLHRVVKAPGSK